VIVADTGAIVALVDADDAHHEELRSLYEVRGQDWVLPSVILAEVDYLLTAHVGDRAGELFRLDLAKRAYRVEWGQDRDLVRASTLCRQYADLRIGLVDATVMATAERLGAAAIATTDLRHFGAVRIAGHPLLVPRDLGGAGA
jgi:uncharacterized protein